MIKIRHKKKKGLCLLLSLLLLASSSFTVSAAKEGSENTEPQGPYFIVYSEDPAVDCFPLKATDVTANISGTIVDAYVTQTYTNEGPSPINANYVFPVSSDVTIHGMTMQIGDNIVTAQIKEKEEAVQEYKTAKEEGKSASLMEQQRPNVFTMDVANIMPGDEVRIELHYTELITPADGIYEFRFPTVVGPRYAKLQQNSETETEEWVVSPYLPDGQTPPGEYHISVNLSAGVPISELSCKSHEINVVKDGEDKAQITLANPEDYAGNRDFILKYKLTGEEIQSGIVLTQSESENYFMLSLQPPERYTMDEVPPREYIFVLDVSGSMYGYPLETAKSLIEDLVSSLRETDQFNLVLFADESSRMSPQSLSATEENIERAIKLIDRQEGNGGTAMAPAVETAINIPLDEDTARSIVIITDGYIFDEDSIFDLIHQNMDTTSFFSFGIGSSVNDYLIGGIAKAGSGESFIVTDSEDAADCADRFRTYIQAPLLTDIAVSYDGFEVYDVEPAIPSTLFAEKPIVLYGKWRGEASGTIQITGTNGNEDYVQEVSVADVAVAEDNEAISYLWARTRLERLTDYGCNKYDEDVKEEVTQIGLTYSMMTPYTSFVAVIDTVRNPEGESTDVDQASPLPLGVSNLAVGGGYFAYSEPSDILLILTAACVMLIPVLYRRGRRMRIQ
ncbi:MAG: VWA domain-containing protein [Candidatus Gastranaerophilales bacterium]|nr:VWA domain-containing protein [Candidatus Gastranaerophilales bacterium]